ncbi:MAG: GIY-YIG nuclease family protein [Alphaproteobacteria bacterium]|nr:GIY-YIG nuclease family protein [Alphaproteobacteria bacterium]MBU1513014.1 GIY-YIG nuclease family protein [Alphaproteobacteria bacterium]MBU2095122.1 GIY-YIG nuclease family protein [Alphaproteobacteria bacterium]MBU2152137.1 GIY-YIG nuclease family protein [Alphaproteobacteria bacterium]MBU2306373.1 GIY-YIG nuclease family protein [Alphaproteobacteria bacterium]
MDKQSRREAIREYKEKKTQSGVYAVRCAATAEVWVAASRNIDAQQNSLWFGLRSGGHPNKGLQATWATHGQDGLSYEVLERVEAGELTPLGLADLVKTRERHWLAALGAKKAGG